MPLVKKLYLFILNTFLPLFLMTFFISLFVLLMPHHRTYGSSLVDAAGISHDIRKLG